jgi:hypothetical protein
VELRDRVPQHLLGMLDLTEPGLGVLGATWYPISPRHVHRLWRRLHTTGDRQMRIVAPGEALSVVENWPGHHPFMCWSTIYTMAYVFEAMGYKHWSVERTACVSHGGQRCQTVLRYRR